MQVGWKENVDKGNNLKIVKDVVQKVKPVLAVSNHFVRGNEVRNSPLAQNKETFQLKYPEVRYTEDDLESLAKGVLQYWKSSYKIKGDNEKLAKKWGRENGNRREQRKRLVCTYFVDAPAGTDPGTGQEPPREGSSDILEEIPRCP